MISSICGVDLSTIMWKLVILCGLVSSVFGGVKDSFINFGGFICPREDRALGRCLRDALNTYIPQLASGFPEHNIPSCEPLFVPSLSVQQSAGPISITATFKDVTVKGPSHMRVNELKVNTKKNQLVAKVHIPELRMRGNYQLSGQVLMLPIEGDGQFVSKYDDIDAEVTIILGRRHRDNDVDTVKVEHLDVKFHIEAASMQLENLFGDEDMSNAMNNFLNENWKKFADELQTPMETALRDFFLPLANHAFGTLKADDILFN